MRHILSSSIPIAISGLLGTVILMQSPASGQPPQTIEEVDCGRFVCRNVDRTDVSALQAATKILTEKMEQQILRYRLRPLVTRPSNCADSSAEVAADLLSEACKDPDQSLNDWSVDNIVSDLEITGAPSGKTYHLYCENATMLTSPDGARSYGIDIWGAREQGVFRLNKVGDGQYTATVPITVKCSREMDAALNDPRISSADKSFLRQDRFRVYSDPTFRKVNTEDKLIPEGLPPRVHGRINCGSGTLHQVGTMSLAPAVSTANASSDSIPIPGICATGESSLPVRGTSVSSFDPNDKVGSQGSGNGQYLASDNPLRYSIFFENVETATAPAQEVVITDQLDTSKIDLNTLSLGPVSFGNKQIVPPPSLTEYTTIVDLRPAKQLLVIVGGRLNKTTGLLTWRFTSVDPVTGQFPDDPLAGFLPPNKVPPEGDGSVLFTVMPQKGLSTGTEIRNRAQIIFDTNAPIDTPEWLNTLDNTKPASNILSLPAVQNTASFQVQWQGTDVGSGVLDYTIYVSENGGPFTPWLLNSAATSGTFTGQPGITYGFYSLARDRTGNLEDAPALADVATQIAVGYEGDVAPRPNGSGTLVVSDWVQVGRFSVGLDTPASGSEFQRADCAPRAALGDGQITIADWVQAGRYSVGLDPLTDAGGPVLSANSPLLLSQRQNAPSGKGTRWLRVNNQRLAPEQEWVSVPVELVALGGENGASFTIEYDPMVLRYDGHELGHDSRGRAQVLVQTKQVGQGRLGLGIVLQPGGQYAAGVRELIRLRFKVVEPAAWFAKVKIGEGLTPLSLVNDRAQNLPVKAIRNTLQGGELTPSLRLKDRPDASDRDKRLLK